MSEVVEVADVSVSEAATFDSLFVETIDFITPDIQVLAMMCHKQMLREKPNMFQHFHKVLQDNENTINFYENKREKKLQAEIVALRDFFLVMNKKKEMTTTLQHELELLLDKFGQLDTNEDDNILYTLTLFPHIEMVYGTINYNLVHNNNNNNNNNNNDDDDDDDDDDDELNKIIAMIVEKYKETKVYFKTWAYEDNCVNELLKDVSTYNFLENDENNDENNEQQQNKEEEEEEEEEEEAEEAEEVTPGINNKKRKREDRSDENFLETTRPIKRSSLLSIQFVIRVYDLMKQYPSFQPSEVNVLTPDLSKYILDVLELIYMILTVMIAKNKRYKQKPMVYINYISKELLTRVLQCAAKYVLVDWSYLISAAFQQLRSTCNVVHPFHSVYASLPKMGYKFQ